MRSLLIAGVALVALTVPLVPHASAQQPGAAPVAAQSEPPRALVGLMLRNPANESSGEISDVIFDRDGRVREVVIRVGGFLRIGERNVAIGVDRLRYDATRDVVLVNMTKEQVRALPEYRPDQMYDSDVPISSDPPPALATVPPTMAPTPNR